MAKSQTASGNDRTGLIPARWILAFFGSCGFMAIYGLKANLSVAIIAMVNHTAVLQRGSYNHNDTAVLQFDSFNDSAVRNDSQSTECHVEAEIEALEDGPFDWDENIQGLVLAAYFYGYIVTQVPGGWVAEKFSAKQVFGLGTFLNAVLTVLSPVCAKASYAWFVAARIGMGIAGGVTLPAMHALIAAWAPPQERSRIASSIYAGMTLGTLICMPLSGYLASELGWESVFYVQGGLTVVWYVLWLFLVFDSPAKHPKISLKERKYIEDSISQLSGSKSTEKMPIPWKKVWTSMPVWAIIVAHTCNNWGWYMLLVKLPTYMKYILHFNIKANAWLSCVPFLCMWLFTMAFASMLDFLRGKELISTTLARKLSVFTASVLPGCCLILVTYVGCNTALAVLFLTMGTMFVGGMYTGILTNHIDIAPPFAGTLMGISNTFATVPGIVVPSFIGYITHGSQTVETWRFIFFLTFGILLTEAVFYGIFGSGEQQEWAKRKRSPDQEETEPMNLKETK